MGMVNKFISALSTIWAVRSSALNRGVCCLLVGRCTASGGGWCPVCRDSVAVASSSIEICSHKYSALLNVRFMTVVLYQAVVYLLPLHAYIFFLAQEVLSSASGIFVETT